MKQVSRLFTGLFISNLNKRVALTILIIFSHPVLSDFHFDNEPIGQLTAADQQLSKEIERFLADYAQAYNQQNYKAVKSMWMEDDLPIYLAEEVPMPLYGWKKLEKYFNPVPGKKILDGIYNEYSQVRAKRLGGNVAVATYRLDYDIKLIKQSPLHGWSRVMAVFINDDDQWKLSAYAEAPMGPLTMVKKMIKKVPASTHNEQRAYQVTKSTIKSLFEQTVDPSFDAYLAEQQDLMPVHD